MKKTSIAIAGFISLAGFMACNDSSTDSTTKVDSNTVKSSDTNNADNKMKPGEPNTNTTVKTPLSKEDSMFVMKAAMGGKMEVDAGNMAQTNAANERVKAFGQMMVTDHTNANNDLMTLASSRGVTLPSDLPADMKKHEDAMSKMQGKSFDNHYMSMMLDDHKKDIAEFEKAAKSNDADIKSFAERTLPTLKKHLDSALAISKMKM